MSAFQVSDEHINALVFARYVDRVHGIPLDGMSDDELGRMLCRENLASLAGRYPDEKATDDDAYRFAAAFRAKRPAVKLSIVEQIKAVHCYQYQSCEHEGWETSKARDYCERLIAILIHKLPGYEAAPWGL